tara:strand:+ start:10506 stop:10886 length:381 start_codon:yes stop_codon:yes gene_type:complete
MKNGKITHIDPNGVWNDKSKYKVTFADGNQYTFFAIGDFKFSVGEIINYEVTNQEYKNAKIPKDQYKTIEPMPDSNLITTVKSYDKNDMIIKQTCLKASAEFNAQRSVGIEDLIKDAELMYNWVKQ